MIRYAAKLDQLPAALIGGVLLIYFLAGFSEMTSPSRDGMTASFAPYLPLLIGIVWAAPVLAREMDAGTAAWAWSMGADRRAWLRSRLAPMLAASVVAGAVLAGLVILVQRTWDPSMTRDRITPSLLLAAPPSLVGLCVVAVAVGALAAVTTRRTVPSVAVTAVVVFALAYAVPSVAVAVTPTHTTNAELVTGHLNNQRMEGAATVTTYIPNSDFWAITTFMGVGLLALAAVLLLATARVIRTVQQ